MYKIIGADGEEYGPISAGQIRQWISENRANRQTLVQAEGSADWKPLAVYPEFADAFQPALPPTLPSTQPAIPTFAPITPPDVPNHLIFSILVTLLCCLPLGVPAIIYSTQVNTRLSNGDIAGAKVAAQKAKLWCWIALGVGALWYIILATSMANFRIAI